MSRWIHPLYSRPPVGTRGGPAPRHLRATAWVYRHITQEVCPFTQKFAVAAAERDYAARAAWEAEWDADPADPDDEGPAEAVIPTTDGPALVDLMRMSEGECKYGCDSRSPGSLRARYRG